MFLKLNIKNMIRKLVNNYLNQKLAVHRKIEIHSNFQLENISIIKEIQNFNKVMNHQINKVIKNFTAIANNLNFNNKKVKFLAKTSREHIPKEKKILIK